jgi:hypothetical protein
MTQPEIDFKANSIDEIHYKVMSLLIVRPISDAVPGISTEDLDAR